METGPEAQVPLSAPLSLTRLPAYMSPEEMYKVTRGIAGEWGIEGYEVPSKAVLYGKEKHTFSKSLRKTQSEEKLRTQGEIPAPGKYDPEEKLEPRSKTHRPVFKAPRNSYIDAIFKRPKWPGPGHYFEQKKGDVEKLDPKKIRGPAVSLSSGLNYLSTCEYYGTQSPGPGAYFPQDKPGKEKKPDGLKPSYFFRSPHPSKPQEKQAIGPGTYYTKNYVSNIKDPTQPLYKDPLRASAPRVGMPKSNPITALEVRARLTKDVPGVGHYLNSTTPLESFQTDKKKIHLAIMKEQGTRFPQDVIKAMAHSKGPGFYNQEDDEDVLKKKS